jgi:hypothetical protein
MGFTRKIIKFKFYAIGDREKTIIFNDSLLNPKVIYLLYIIYTQIIPIFYYLLGLCILLFVTPNRRIKCP